MCVCVHACIIQCTLCGDARVRCTSARLLIMLPRYERLSRARSTRVCVYMFISRITHNSARTYMSQDKRSYLPLSTSLVFCAGMRGGADQRTHIIIIVKPIQVRSTRSRCARTKRQAVFHPGSPAPRTITTMKWNIMLRRILLHLHAQRRFGARRVASIQNNIPHLNGFCVCVRGLREIKLDVCLCVHVCVDNTSTFRSSISDT